MQITQIIFIIQVRETTEKNETDHYRLAGHYQNTCFVFSIHFPSIGLLVRIVQVALNLCMGSGGVGVKWGFHMATKLGENAGRFGVLLLRYTRQIVAI